MSAPATALPVSSCRAGLLGLVAMALAHGGCGPAPRPDPPPVPVIRAVHPGIVLPGTRLVVEGESFADDVGTTRVAIRGQSTSGNAIESWIPATAESDERVVIDVARELWQRLGEGVWAGELVVVVEVAGSQVISTPHATDLELREHLDPARPAVEVPELVYVNDDLLVVADGLLLSGEGRSEARLSGCVRRGDGCEPVVDLALPLEPVGEFERSAARFAWSPALAGIRAGRFEGEVRIDNTHVDGVTRSSETSPLSAELEETEIFGPTAIEASLGQYIDIDGAGFIDADDRGATLLGFVGELDTGEGEPEPVDLILVPRFQSGRVLRYVLAEDDALGARVDLRNQTAILSGQIRPIVEYDGDTLQGPATALELDIAPVLQVVHLVFSEGYQGSLELFGMRSADARIRQRIATIIERDFAGINLDVRLDEPDDFALYSVVEIGGADPNGLGLLGNDNTPGKDVGNIRLHDRLGGVNALTQFDGYPGYGGVFIESLFVYSQRSVGDYRGIDTSATADPRFDQIFDPLREDRGGEPVTGSEAAGLSVLLEAPPCPGQTRVQQLDCAVWTLGSLIGTTVSHEIGHSLGLADPFGAAFHNFGDRPGRIMDRGGARPFGERAELDGEGPGVFCQEHFDYLQTVLPGPGDPLAGARPSCD